MKVISRYENPLVNKSEPSDAPIEFERLKTEAAKVPAKAGAVTAAKIILEFNIGEIPNVPKPNNPAAR